jgi:hypothetical protein
MYHFMYSVAREKLLALCSYHLAEHIGFYSSSWSLKRCSGQLPKLLEPFAQRLQIEGRPHLASLPFKSFLVLDSPIALSSGWLHTLFENLPGQFYVRLNVNKFARR